MLKKLAAIFSPQSYQQEAYELYTSLVSTSRNPAFYSDMQVADTVDGRFDMIALHMFIEIERIKKSARPDAQELVRALSEAFFADMDRSLREMGSTDTGVGKRIKKMSQAFYGRMEAYEKAHGNDAKMKEALAKNVYRGASVSDSAVQKLADYVKQALG